MRRQDGMDITLYVQVAVAGAVKMKSRFTVCSKTVYMQQLKGHSNT